MYCPVRRVNDVVVGKSTIARLNHCDVYIDQVFVSRYQADSLIVATPTGSTAYSLAAGGPVLMPSVKGLVVTPVSAHSLSHRPLVATDTSVIEIVAKTGSDEAYLSLTASWEWKSMMVTAWFAGSLTFRFSCFGLKVLSLTFCAPSLSGDNASV